MSNINNSIISQTLDNDKYQVINEAMPSCACTTRLKTSVLIEEFIHTKENIIIENKIEAEYRMIVDISKLSVTIILFPYL